MKDMGEILLHVGVAWALTDSLEDNIKSWGCRSWTDSKEWTYLMDNSIGGGYVITVIEKD